MNDLKDRLAMFRWSNEDDRRRVARWVEIYTALDSKDKLRKTLRDRIKHHAPAFLALIENE